MTSLTKTMPTTHRRRQYRLPISKPFFAIAATLLMLVSWHFDSIQVNADTYAYGGSSAIWGKARDDGSQTWRIFNPTAADQIHWIDGTNRADATVVTSYSTTKEPKFDHTGTTIGAKNYAQLNAFFRGTSGSWVRTRGWGGGTINSGVPTCRWTNTVQGGLGNGKSVYWKGRCQGKDPFHIFPADLANMQITDRWDAFFVTGLDQNTSVGARNGSIDLNVFYDTASETTELLHIQILPDEVIVTGDAPNGLQFFAMDELDSSPPIGQQPITLEELKTLMEIDMLLDRNLGSPLYIGIVWEDLPVPTVDLGNGAVARFRIETTVDDEASAEVISFQQNVDDYQGLLDVIIGNDIDSGNGNIIGSNVESATINGFYSGPADRQALFHFADIENIIPPDARIVDATFHLMTPPNAGSDSFGPFGVGQLMIPFDENASFVTSNGGYYFANGQSERPLGGGFFGTQPNEFSSADITQIVQSWVNGQPNHGLAVSSGTLDDWEFFSSGVGLFGLQDPTAGPVIDVSFTDPPGLVSQAPITVDINSVNSFFDVFVVDENGNAEDGANADPLGAILTGGPMNRQLLVRPQFIFQSQGGQVPDNAQITSAKIVLFTSPATFDQNVGTSDDFGVRPILAPWDPSAPIQNLNVGPFVDITSGIVADAQVQMDITPIVEAWQQGQPMDGISIASLGGSDEWAVHLTSAGPDLAPQLLIEFQYEPIVVQPISFSVVQGQPVSGSLTQLRESDNVDLSIRRSSSDIQSRTGFEVTGFSPHANPTGISVRLENSVFARTPVNQAIELWNFQTAAWESVDTQPAQRFSDSTVEVDATGDLSRFVETNTLGMKARVRMNSISPRQQFTSNTDAFSWTIE